MDRVPYLLPWVSVLLLIRSITSTTWGYGAAGTAQAPTSWRAVQRAAWDALKR